MAQEIMVAGAVYEDVPSVRLPDSNGVFHPFTDTSDTTAVAADVAQGKTFHLADGSAATGTAAGATLVTKSITANGTYSAEDDDADGYSEVTVNVSGGGGGGGGVDPKDVNFIDFDGTIVYSYTAAEFAELTAMPANPSHDGLVAQGWNWSLSDAQDYVAEYGIQTIGQMYTTESGAIEIDLVLRDRRELHLRVTGDASITIDWGDGSSPSSETLTGSTVDIQHSYGSGGFYTISISAASGTYGLVGSSGGGSLGCVGFKSTSGNVNYGALTNVTAIRLNDGALLSQGMPNGLRNASLSIPRQCNITNSALTNLPMSAVTLPQGLTEIADSLFETTSSVPYGPFRLSIPKTVTRVGGYAFKNCINLTSISIPDEVTEIGSQAFYGCYSLTSLTIPESVTTINDYAFGNCYGLGGVHFKSSAPPTAQSNAFYKLPTDCKIYVPRSSLTAYKRASNYPSSSTYTYVEE